MKKTAKEKLAEWFEDQKKNHGLLDIKLTLGDTSKANVEDVCASVLRLIKAKERGEFKRLAVACN